MTYFDMVLKWIKENCRLYKGPDTVSTKTEMWLQNISSTKVSFVQVVHIIDSSHIT